MASKEASGRARARAWGQGGAFGASRRTGGDETRGCVWVCEEERMHMWFMRKTGIGIRWREKLKGRENDERERRERKSILEISSFSTTRRRYFTKHFLTSQS
jgi:hypothetical protein